MSDLDNVQFSTKYYNEANQKTTLKAIYNALSTRLVEKNITHDVINDILKINGLDTEHFDFIKQIQHTLIQNINDMSIDDNSNKGDKTISGIVSEAVAPIKKAIGFDSLYRVMKEMYGKKEAKHLSSLMYDYSLGLSDSTNILLPYCYALDGTKLVIEGRPFGQLKSKPPKRVDSYISALNETVHQLSSHFAGAIAIGTFFFDIAHILLVRNKVYPSIWFAYKDNIKYIENCYQTFVHSVNHLSRNGNESPFTNISIFDPCKLYHIIKNDLAWYYSGIDEKDVLDTILQLQDIYLNFFDKGDPSANGMPYRFPVTTINLSKEGDKLVCNDFLEKIVKKDIYRYNIFTSQGTKVCSCCRLINDAEMLEMAAQSNSFGAGALSNLGSHRVCTINFNRIALEAKDYNDYFYILYKRLEAARMILKAHKVLLKKLSEVGLQPFITNGWIALSRLFSTFGIMGLYEADNTMKRKFGTFKGICYSDYDNDFKAAVLKYVNEYSINATKEDAGYVYNQEVIPGESYAVRLCTVDKLLYGEDNVPYTMYSNQWIPLWENASIWDKLKEDGKYNQMITGGGIVHATIGEKVTPTQAKEIIEYAVKVGCEHFALNAVYSKCKNDHMSFGDIDVCPTCGSDIQTKLTRIVGYYTPVENWNKTRREWEFPRRTKIN